jgi:hypothetical protein
LDTIVDILNLLQKGSLETRWGICAEICDFDRQEKLSSSQLSLTLNLILKYASPASPLLIPRLYEEHIPVVSTQDFVAMIYDKLEISPSQPLLLELITTEIIKKPLFSELFGLKPMSPTVARKGGSTDKLSRRNTLSSALKL